MTDNLIQLGNNELILFYAYTLLDNLTETRDKQEINHFIERKRKEFELQKLWDSWTSTTMTDHGEEIATITSKEQEFETEEI